MSNPSVKKSTVTKYQAACPPRRYKEPCNPQPWVLDTGFNACKTKQILLPSKYGYYQFEQMINEVRPFVLTISRGLLVISPNPDSPDAAQYGAVFGFDSSTKIGDVVFIGNEDAIFNRLYRICGLPSANNLQYVLAPLFLGSHVIPYDGIQVMNGPFAGIYVILEINCRNSSFVTRPTYVEKFVDYVYVRLEFDPCTVANYKPCGVSVC